MIFQKTPRIALCAGLLFILAACLDSGPSTPEALPQIATLDEFGDANFYFKMPTPGNRNRFISVDANSSLNRTATPGNGIRLSIRTHQNGSVGRTVQLLEPLDQSLAVRVADDDGRGEIPESEVLRFGRQLARQSVCQNGEITANTFGRRVTNPADISAVLAANGGQVLGGRIPDSIQGEPIPPIELNRFGWEISLWCR